MDSAAAGAVLPFRFWPLVVAARLAMRCWCCACSPSLLVENDECEARFEVTGEDIYR